MTQQPLSATRSFAALLEKVRADLELLREKRLFHLSVEPGAEERVLINLTAMLEHLEARIYALEPRED